MNVPVEQNHKRVLISVASVITVIGMLMGATVYLLNRLANIETMTKTTNDRLDVIAKQLAQRRTQTFTVPMFRLWLREFSAANPGMKLPDTDAIIRVFPDE